MRSTETVSKPAACAVSTAARACCRAVAAAEEAQGVVGEGLHPEGEGSHPEAPPGGAGVGRHVLGVGLQEDPGRGRREREVRAAGVEHAREVLGRQQRGRSPAEVHGVEGPGVAPRARGEGHLGDQVLDEALAGGDARAQHREVAVRADGRAEGDVEVEPGSAAARLEPSPRPRRPRSGAPPRRPPAGSPPPPPSSSSSCPPSASRAACACGRCRPRSTSPSRPCGRG